MAAVAVLAGVGLAALTLALAPLRAAGGQLEASFFDGAMHPSIAYASRPRTDAIARLSAALEAGTLRLQFDERSGYLRSLLKALDVDADSQIAVFSKTSLQAPFISPRNPRAIYFNDQVTVAWPRGGFIEIAAQDRTQGTAFYMLEQRDTAVPRFEQPGNCLTCHVSYATLNVPGLLVRSVATAPDGRGLPFLANGTDDHRTPFAERWAGWFVTGQTSGIAHLGNATVTSRDAALVPAATPLESMAARIDATGYLSPHSDVAALLVFNHQAHMQNLLTRIGWQTRVALADKDRDAARTIASAAADVVDYMLFVDEPPLPAPAKGASGFAERFSTLGPRDRAGRSLHQLDLQTRLLKYPCSYMIYSEVFEALPAEAKEAIYARLGQVLSGAEIAPRYRRLSSSDRQAITEILRDTKPGIPPSFGG